MLNRCWKDLTNLVSYDVKKSFKSFFFNIIIAFMSFNVKEKDKR